MEAFESFVALALESEGLVVSGAVKFPVTRQTRKADRVEIQTHGFEVDLVAANAERLVLTSVKSFFGSRGVVADHVLGVGKYQHVRLYAILNDEDVRSQVLKQACDRYGYLPEQVEMRLYVGRFAAPTTGEDEKRVREWAAETIAGGAPIKVFNLSEVVGKVVGLAAQKQYRDNPVLVTLKVLDAAGLLITPPSDDGAGVAGEKPGSGVKHLRFSQEECLHAANVVRGGGGASDGVTYDNRKVAQQVAWELRHGIEHHAGIRADTLRSETVAEDAGYTFVVYAK